MKVYAGKISVEKRERERKISKLLENLLLDEGDHPFTVASTMISGCMNYLREHAPTAHISHMFGNATREELMKRVEDIKVDTINITSRKLVEIYKEIEKQGLVLEDVTRLAKKMMG